ncbi:hypothetical protein LJC60_08185 [Ruminococcaceae bacterium OttesenSCG-928-D13]|nr:hypothetical protein [Ruminococcaceae bacterium OttesenSCG-928-D13]
MRIIKMVSVFALAVVMLAMTACGGGGASISSSDATSSSTVESSSSTPASDDVSSDSKPVFDVDATELITMTRDEVVAVLGEPDDEKIGDRAHLFYADLDLNISFQSDGSILYIWIGDAGEVNVPLFGVVIGDTAEEVEKKMEGVGERTDTHAVRYMVEIDGIECITGFGLPNDTGKVSIIRISPGTTLR